MTNEYDRLIELKQRNRCIKCKGRIDEAVTCEWCYEFNYCSIQCLTDDRDAHQQLCSFIGYKKGLLATLTDEEAKGFKKAKEMARYLNDDGSLRITETPGGALQGRDEDRINASDNDKNPTGAWTPKSKKNKGKKRKNKGRNSNGKNKSEGGNVGKVTREKSLESLIAGGTFGGAVRVDQKVESGKNFGEGWFQRNTDKTTTTTGSSSNVRGSGVTDTSGKMKFKDFYNDSEDEKDDEENKPKTANEKDDNSASFATATSGSEPPLEEAMSGLEIVKYDPKKAEEQKSNSSSQGSSTWSKCSYCKKEGFMLKCSRCKLTEYCNKACQKNHYQNHKDICRRKERFDMALDKVPRILKMAIIMKTGDFKVSPFLGDLRDELTYMFFGPSLHVIVEIIDTHPNPFRHGAFVRDLAGMITHVLFYGETNLYMHISTPFMGMALPIHLSRCIRPGNFILLIGAHWHNFLDGTRGIRIDDLDDVHFIFMDQ